MKLNLNKAIYLVIILQILSVQGIIIFNIFKTLGNWELKSIIHPVSVFLLLILVMLLRIKKGSLKITSIDLLLIAYFSICFIILIFNTGNFSKIFISFREVFLVSVLIFTYQQIDIPKRYWKKILKFIYILVIANLLFVLLTYILGPEEYMKLLTGRFRWGNDTEYKFKISNFLYFWRSPGLIGSPANVGYFGLIAYLLFDQDDTYKKKRVFAIILAIIGFVRSVYVVLIIYWFLKFMLTKKNIKKLRYMLPYIFPILFLAGYFLYTKGILDLTSLFMRINHWIYNIPVDYNVLFGGGIGEAGGAVRGEGFVATLDSYWLLMLLSVGLVGIVLLVLFVYEKAKGNNKLIYILIGFLFAGLFITLTQGMAFLVLFPLLFLKKQTYLENDST